MMTEMVLNRAGRFGDGKPIGAGVQPERERGTVADEGAELLPDGGRGPAAPVQPAGAVDRRGRHQPASRCCPGDDDPP